MGVRGSQEKSRGHMGNTSRALQKELEPKLWQKRKGCDQRNNLGMVIITLLFILWRTKKCEGHFEPIFI